MKHFLWAFLLLMFISLVGCGTPAPPLQGMDAPTQAETLQAPPTLEITPPPQAEFQTRPPGDSVEIENLPFDEFLEESWLRILRRDPELITELGLSEAFGLRNDQLTDISETYRLETYALYAQTLDALQTYDRASLTPAQQLNFDIYAYHLENTLRGQEFLRYDYPITHFVTGTQYQLINLFTEIHPLRNRQDAEDYLARLAQVDTKFAQVIENMQLSEQAGVITPRLILQWSQRDIRKIAASSARETPFYTRFSEKLATLTTLGSAEKNALLAAAEAEIEATVIPAFGALATYLADLETRAPTDVGVWQHPQGAAYYAYRVQHYTTTDLAPETIHQMGLADLARIQAEMRLIFDQLGYPRDESLSQSFARVRIDGGVLSGREIAAGYESLIADAKVRVAQVIDLQPQADVIVVPGATGGYYIGPAVDGSRPGAFYAAISGAEPRYNMASLAYHEAIPGHHTQIALALEMDLPSFRRGSLFTAYVEGWALYAEKLMAEIGAYETDPYGNLGRLQYEAFRAARLVVDTGIHDQGWTFDQAVDFMVQNTGMEREMLQFEVARYVAWPAQALAYKIGMSEIVRLRAKAEAQLGEKFELRQFHNLILGSGAVPLEILEQIVDDFVDQTLP